MFEMRWTKS